MFRGNVVSIHIARDAAAPMESRGEVKAVAGHGLEGDRYFNGTGHWSKSPGVSREVTLIELESIEALEREKSLAIAPGAARLNLSHPRRDAESSRGSGVPCRSRPPARNAALRTLRLPRRSGHYQASWLD
jgi:hypothetical protein